MVIFRLIYNIICFILLHSKNPYLHYGSCCRCYKSWGIVTPHHMGRGHLFVLCEGCYNKLSFDQRFAYYAKEIRKLQRLAAKGKYNRSYLMNDTVLRKAIYADF